MSAESPEPDSRPAEDDPQVVDFGALAFLLALLLLSLVLMLVMARH